MQYAVSDLHGCYDKYIRLLDRIALRPSDTLYILGDIVDRGPDGLKILRDIATRPNLIPFLGNHEYAAMTCLPWLMEKLNEKNTEEDVLLWRLQSIQGWVSDGGDKTIQEFRKLSPDSRRNVLDLLEDVTVYAETEAGGNQFLLVHAGLQNFAPDRDLEDYRLEELILGRPDPEREYFTDKYLVFGHTPTPYFFGQASEDEMKTARVFRKNHLIGIDCGCVFGGPLACLCLDTMEEIYV